MKTIRLVLAYDGTGYHGWQIQPNGISIQQTLENSLARITGESVTVLSAGRTDAGVHALGQVAAFRTQSRHTPEIFLRALNATLPDDIRILAADEAPDAFHPRFDAKSKIYTYLIANHADLSPFAARYAWRIRTRLDREAMETAAACLVGKHDFTSFQASGCAAQSAVRTLTACAVEELSGIDFLGFSLPGRFIRISVEADAFLRHMVRNIVGTLAEVGSAKRKAGAVSELLQLRNRSAAGPTAPACGLFLYRVLY
jgi:tRNA pseudouridine38-40 synthase